MGYSSVWKVLDQLVADFRERGATVPDKVMKDLKSARTVLNAPKTSQSGGEALEKIEAYLANVESYLISEGEKRFGNKYSEKWLRKLDKASREISDEDKEEARFVPSFPREHKWIRVKPSNDLPLEKLETLVKESGLSFKSQNDRYLLVYGTDEQVKDFVKKITKKQGQEPGK
jgi:hypothetical protein